MKDERPERPPSGERTPADRESLRRQVRHPYITRQEPRRRGEDEGGSGEEEAPPRPAS